MKNFLVGLALLFSFFCALPARAQFVYPLRVSSSGTLVNAQTLTLNFTSGCTPTKDGSIGSQTDVACGGAGLFFADAPLTGNGSSGSHLQCPTCALTTGTTFTGTVSIPNTVSTSAAPSCAVTANAGTGGGVGCTVVGTNTGGVVTRVLGTSAWATGTQFTVTFSGGFAFPSGCAVIIEYNDANTSGNHDLFTVNRPTYANCPSSSTWILGFGGAAFNAQFTLKYNYVVVGY